jgi:lipopolysaccharide export system permease protein
MRLLDRYLLREFLVPLGYCLCGFLVFWIASELFANLHQLQEKHLQAMDIAEYYFFRIPEFLPIALPVALLLALLYALSNHARHNELTAIRAAGVSLWRLSVPYLAVGFAGSAVLFALDEFCAPITASIAEQVLNRRVQHPLGPGERDWVKNLDFQNSRAGRNWHIGLYNQKTGEMVSVLVVWREPDDSWRQIIADRARRINGVWTFYRVREISQSAATNAIPSRRQMPELALPEFSETPREIRSEISVSDRFAHQARTKRADVPIADILNYLRLNPEVKGSIRSWLFTKLNGRFAAPCTCLVVILIGVPFAAGSGRRNVFVGVAASLTIFFVYYLVQQFGFAFGEAGRVPAWLAAWLPNLSFALAGLWMMAKVR